MTRKKVFQMQKVIKKGKKCNRKADIVDREQGQLAVLVRMCCARSHPRDISDEVEKWIYLFMRRKDGHVSSDLKLLETELRDSRSRDFSPPRLNSTI